MTLLLALNFVKSVEFLNSSCDFIKSDVYASMYLCVSVRVSTLYCAAP